ncbi:MAG: DUF459 domain-containing protein [Dehalococcoidia bacterium]|nr:DUF459 domain-containing protein [Dehalococcoidia bacterium]
MVAALLIAALLNGEALKRNAEQMPFGNERDFWLTVWTPFDFVSDLFFLNEPRRMLDREFGNDTGGDLFELPVSVDGSPPDSAQPGGDGGDPPEGNAGPSEGNSDGETDAKKPPATPTPPAQLVRTPTAEQPLALWVGGDSMAQVLGESVVRMADESGLFSSRLDYRISTGLTRPDYFDWPGHLAGIVQADPKPEVMVVVFGGNDSQGIKTPEGKIYQPGDEGWAQEYARRVAGTMDVLRAEGRLVVWVGQPVMRSAEFTDRMAELNAIYQEAAASRPWIRYVDLFSLFATPSGTYDAYLADDDGDVVLMRQADGIHLSRDGGDRAAKAIMDAIYAEAGVQP